MIKIQYIIVYELVKEQKLDTYLTAAAGEVGGQEEEEVGKGKEGEKKKEEGDREGEEEKCL